MEKVTSLCQLTQSWLTSFNYPVYSFNNHSFAKQGDYTLGSVHLSVMTSSHECLFRKFSREICLNTLIGVIQSNIG